MRLSHLLLASPLVLLAVPATAAPGDEAKLKAIEVAWGKALVKADTNAIKTFTAPEWTFQGSGPKPQTRAEALADLASGKEKLTSYAVRDLRVKVIGDVAYVAGYDDEKSSYDGKDTSGTYGFLDVFQRRNGKWVALVTQGGKVGS
jgi:ketosteroid isomerase-like protein